MLKIKIAMALFIVALMVLPVVFAARRRARRRD